LNNESAIHRTIEAVWRMESARIIAKLARMLRNVGLAEEMAQDALVSALEQWPRTGPPDNPGAWLMTAAKNRALDELRRRKLVERKNASIVHEAPLVGHAGPQPDEAVDDDIGDDLLRLTFVACHPVLSTEARTALTLRLLGGLTTAEIARAFLLASLVPTEPEVHGLVALMEIQESRAGARTDAAGEPILLMEQNRGRWDQLLIRRGLAALERAQMLGGALGPYALQAAIAACHARAPTAADTDWNRILALYDALAQLMPSPVVELNRAVAVSMVFGPAAGLELVNALAAEAQLSEYHLLPSVRGDLLEKLGCFAEARAEFGRAAALAKNGRERTLLLGRAAACGAGLQ
jgi:RNA polymerase sigma factor (sigma-70 family)